MALALICSWIAAPPFARAAGESIWSFEDVKAGSIPGDWKIEATNQNGALATWEATDDSTAPEGRTVLALSSPNHKSGRTFNLCWTDSIQFQDGRIAVQFKANTGVIDQGGGPIWRAQDKNNYYICRANPLENNLRLYFVKDAKRVQIGSVDVDIPSGVWQTIEIEHKGTRIKCLLNGKELLEIEDEIFAEPGGVGLWTKADAATSFDAFEVKAADGG